VENAVRVDAVKGSQPRAPELEIPRPLGAGVGVWGSSKLVSAWERFQPFSHPAPAGRPPLVRSGIVAGEKKRNGTTPGPGRRVFKLKTSKSIKGKLKNFYNMLTFLLQQVELPKSAFRYRGSGRTAS
jgi:hypothetical protein